MPNDPNWLEIAKASGLINAQKFMKSIMEKYYFFNILDTWTHLFSEWDF